MKASKLVLVSLSVALLGPLAGCGGRSEDEIARLQREPLVQSLGVIDGCDVKYVDRGYQIHSFYLAKCGATTTTTVNYEEAQGKSRVFRRSTVIAHEIEQLQKEQTESQRIESALKDVSPAKRKALGLD